MVYLKHKDAKTPKKGKAVKEVPAQMQPAVVRVDADLSGIEVAIAELASAVCSYAHNATIGENILKIFTGEEGAGNYPVLIALDPCSETTEDMLAVAGRIATAFERIADALGAAPGRASEGRQDA
jgi:hypothetical protein